MIIKQYNIIQFALLVLFLFSCGDRKKPPVEKIFSSNISVRIIASKSKFVTGDSVIVGIDLVDPSKDTRIKKLQIDNNTIDLAGHPMPFNYSWKTDSATVGRHTLTVTAIGSDSVRDSKSISVELFSNVTPSEYTYRVVHTYPHDTASFTEGFEFHDGVLYEGTGLKGESRLRKVELETGKVLKELILPPNYFGEGITIFNKKIYELTYQTQIGFIYDLETFNELKKFSYGTEGWGLTHDKTKLIMSDGSPVIYFFDQDFLPVGKTEVYDEKGPVTYINELEYVDGFLFANVWQTDRILIIDPRNGKVTGRVSLAGLLPEKDRHTQTDVLNGIAYDHEKKRLFVTGKMWPKIFEIKLEPKRMIAL